MKLLVAVDGSDNALRAVEHAARLARDNGPVSLHLVTAHEAPVVYGEIAVYVTEDRMAELQRQAAEQRLAEAEAVLGRYGVPCTKEILVGRVPAAIAACADARGCDGIVLGSRGMGAMGNLLLGSVANKVAHLANVPVTLVR